MSLSVEISNHHQEAPAIFTPARKELFVWLLACCGLIMLMVIIGAITRLTDSGLSIVQWRPIMGILPPLNDAQWDKAYELYKASPEFIKKHFWMDLGDFKAIFFWEWLHRLLGRLIGLAYGLPLIYFLARKQIPHGYKLRLIAIFFLGGAQGLLGWYMVESGLIDRPDVSHFRLAAHLSLAVLILSLIFWSVLSLIRDAKHHHAKAALLPGALSPEQGEAPSLALRIHGIIGLAFLCTTMVWGAFTAGLDAGLIYNDTFPQMGDTIVPDEIQGSAHLWHDLTASPAGVQFLHRWLAMSTGIVLLALSLHGLRKLPGSVNRVFIFLALMVLIQIGLGITTLMSGVALPVAVMHQSGALILLLITLACLHRSFTRIP